MTTVFLTFTVVAMLIVFSVDVTQKRRAFLAQQVAISHRH